MHRPHDVVLIIFGVTIVSDVGLRHVCRVYVLVSVKVGSVLKVGDVWLNVSGGVVLALLGQVGCALGVGA